MTASRIAIVGPTHPYTGGVSAVTTSLANRLVAAGHTVDMISWKAQYPRFLRDGATRVAEDRPEVRPVPGTTYPLAWYNPFSWLRVGRSLRRHDIVIVAQITPFHAVPYAGIRMGFGRRPHGVVVAHNVLPHETSRVDRSLVALLYRLYPRVMAHSDEQAEIARSVGPRSARVASSRMPLPDFIFDDVRATGKRPTKKAIELLFFGMVRAYKGLDVLIRALARVPGFRLVVAGEFWEPLEEYTSLIESLGIADRVEINDGYLPMAQVGPMFREADALVLPYRSGSASFNVSLGFVFGLPVLASDAGTLPLDIADGVNGLVFARDDVDMTVAALTKLARPGELERLRKGVNPFLLDEQWSQYVTDLLALAGS